MFFELDGFFLSKPKLFGDSTEIFGRTFMLVFLAIDSSGSFAGFFLSEINKWFRISLSLNHCINGSLQVSLPH